MKKNLKLIYLEPNHANNLTWFKELIFYRIIINDSLTMGSNLSCHIDNTSHALVSTVDNVLSLEEFVARTNISLTNTTLMPYGLKCLIKL